MSAQTQAATTTNRYLIEALGTRHCPHCHFPLFANPYVGTSAEVAEEHREQWLDGFVMLIEDAIDDPGRLIASAESLPLWTHAAVVGDGDHDTEAEAASRRGNDRMSISGLLHPGLADIEQRLRDSIHAGVARYLSRGGNTLQIHSDSGYELLRYEPGQQYTEHVDSMPGSASVYGQRLLSAVLYLNDDFEGGELHFPRQGLTYNPKAGSLVLFPANFCYPHASLPVGRGRKYALVTWFI